MGGLVVRPALVCTPPRTLAAASGIFSFSPDVVVEGVVRLPHATVVGLSMRAGARRSWSEWGSLAVDWFSLPMTGGGAFGGVDVSG
jgi:hypothetical protein